MMEDQPPADSTRTEDHRPDHVITVRLRNPVLAVLWAWLIPGAGHWYQGRRAKSVIFAVCILSTYFFGLVVGGGHVVYASMTRGDFRWHYFCQVGIGVPALPALVLNRRVRSGKPPLFGDIMAPPGPVQRRQQDKLAQWHDELTSKFEIGTLYTMIAGLLNLLVIFDAYGGPFVFPADTAPNKKSTVEDSKTPSTGEKKKPSKKKNRR